MLTIQGYDIEYVYNRDDAFVCFVSGVGAALIVPIGDPEYGKIAEYLASHPDARRPEPLPPAPTDAELEAAAEAQRQALFAEYDLAVKMLSRAERLGDITATAKLAAWDVYAAALQAINNTEGWYLNPQWPMKPEL